MTEGCWYVSYGSNMCRDRFRCYLEGGCPPGGLRDYPGARDPVPPRAEVACWLPGGTYFARESRTWGGGMAFLDPERPGRTPARAYLITRGQLDDIVAQEPGHYETVLVCPSVDNLSAYTFTAPGAALEAQLSAPSAAYLRMLVRGLAEAHGWEPRRAVRYLVGLPGARGAWTEEEALDAVRWS